MAENKAKLTVQIAEDLKAVIEEAKSMGCNKVRALYNIPLENMELIVQALEKQIPKKSMRGEPFWWIDTVKVKGRNKEVRKKSYGHICPSCGKGIAALSNIFCNHCGQAIDWGNEE